MFTIIWLLVVIICLMLKSTTAAIVTAIIGIWLELFFVLAMFEYRREAILLGLLVIASVGAVWLVRAKAD